MSNTDVANKKINSFVGHYLILRASFNGYIYDVIKCDATDFGLHKLLFYIEKKQLAVTYFEKVSNFLPFGCIKSNVCARYKLRIFLYRTSRKITFFKMYCVSLQTARRNSNFYSFATCSALHFFWSLVNSNTTL